MSNDKNNTKVPATLEEAMVVIGKLNEELSASNKENSNLKTELQSANELTEKAQKELEKSINSVDGLKKKHTKELDAVKKGVKNITKSVDGVYKSEKHGVTIKFKDGYVKTRTKDGIVSSEEIIENKGDKYTEFLDHLIGIGYGGIEEVN
jgi:chromosome segregation ATPase